MMPSAAPHGTRKSAGYRSRNRGGGYALGGERRGCYGKIVRRRSRTRGGRSKRPFDPNGDTSAAASSVHAAPARASAQRRRKYRTAGSQRSRSRVGDKEHDAPSK